jgi:hypothetical protein
MGKTDKRTKKYKKQNEWTTFKNRTNKDLITPEQQDLIIKTLKEKLNVSISQSSNCNESVWYKWISKIDEFYNEDEK